MPPSESLGQLKQLVSPFAAMLITRNLLRHSYPDDEEFQDKMRRANFMDRVATVMGLLSVAAHEGTIDLQESLGDWESVAVKLQENGWFSKFSVQALTELLRDSSLMVFKGRYLPGELFGAVTIPAWLADKKNENE